MKAKAIVLLDFSSQKQLNIVLKALEPEVKKSITMRSKTTLKKDNALLILNVEARDTVALRAALNAYLRWINSIVNVLEVLEKQ
jgi:tRNA threonylcarbamoyladenosine modification (KEOPS) complex  Pcc1 subunit